MRRSRVKRPPLGAPSSDQPNTILRASRHAAIVHASRWSTRRSRPGRSARPAPARDPRPGRRRRRLPRGDPRRDPHPRRATSRPAPGARGPPRAPSGVAGSPRRPVARRPGPTRSRLGRHDRAPTATATAPPTRARGLDHEDRRARPGDHHLGPCVARPPVVRRRQIHPVDAMHSRRRRRDRGRRPHSRHTPTPITRSHASGRPRRCPTAHGPAPRRLPQTGAESPVSPA